MSQANAPHTYTDSEQQAIVAMYEGGASAQTIARVYHSNGDRILKLLHALHVPIRARGTYNRGTTAQAATSPARLNYQEMRFIDSIGHGISVRVAAELARIPLQATGTIIARARRIGDL